MRKADERLDIRLARIAWNNSIVDQNILRSNIATINEKEAKKLLRRIVRNKRISELLIGCNDPGYDNNPPQKKINYN